MYIDEYLLVNYKKSESLLSIEWKAESNRLSYENFKKRLSIIDAFTIKFKPKSILANCKHLICNQYGGKTDLMQESVRNGKIKSAIEKLAIITSKDKITDSFIKHTMLNSNLKNNYAKVFNKPIFAQSWLQIDEKTPVFNNEYQISA